MFRETKSSDFGSLALFAVMAIIVHKSIYFDPPNHPLWMEPKINIDYTKGTYDDDAWENTDDSEEV
jgi:hypothetical protein